MTALLEASSISVNVGAARLLQQVSLAVESGETVALGGLIRDRTSRGNSGIPLLKDVPWIGNLFKTTTENDARTELLVLITPRVARGPSDLRGVTDALRRQMRGLPWAIE